jgi:phosphatidate cytidylyltransferase
MMLCAGVILLISANWWAPCLRLPDGHKASTWECLLGVFVALMVAIFIWEMAIFRPLEETPSPRQGSVERMARTLWALMYLGLLPCFLVQLRWLYPANQPEFGSVALALVIFVPKFCDIGAYCFGRLLGRHPLTPVLSPKKTWEGAAGGLAFGALTAIAIDRLGPVPVLHGNLGLEIGFGMSLGVAGMLGDLAESLVKRDCRRKDASDTVPGFGGVLDVVDAVIFAAPLGYLELALLA